jgi:hypothetical protein
VKGFGGGKFHVVFRTMSDYDQKRPVVMTSTSKSEPRQRRWVGQMYVVEHEYHGPVAAYRAAHFKCSSVQKAWCGNRVHRRRLFFRASKQSA